MTILLVALAILLGPSILLALLLILVTVRGLRDAQHELGEAEVQDHARPLGSVVVLDEYRRLG